MLIKPTLHPHPQWQFQIYRTLVTNVSILNTKNVSLGRQGKIMGKFIGERIKGSKKHWYPTQEESAKSSQSSIFTTTQFGRVSCSGGRGIGGKNTTRRMTVLNKLFMKHITDQLAHGQASDSILGRGLQVSRVKITCDFANLNVYWIGSGEATADEQLEKELQRCSGQLRHDLSQLALMGEVPRIKFVRDKTLSNMAQVETLLQNIDFTPTEVEENELMREECSHGTKNTMQSYDTNLVKQELFGVANKTTPLEATSVTEAPEFRYDVLGLEHREIMNKILTKMRKSKQAWELHNRDLISLSSEPAFTQNASDTQSLREKKLILAETAESFNKFLSKRRERKDTPERKKHHRDYGYTDLTTDSAAGEDALMQRETIEEDFIDEDYETDHQKS